jgi:hypothetical protein
VGRFFPEDRDGSDDADINRAAEDGAVSVGNADMIDADVLEPRGEDPELRAVQTNGHPIAVPLVMQRARA